jgi:DedD protein
MSLKQRLIGASVLIALAVIFVPMFLDGAGHRERIAQNMHIPPEPKFKFEEKIPPLPEIGSERLRAPEDDPVFGFRPEPESAPLPKSSSVDTKSPAKVVTKEKPETAKRETTALASKQKSESRAVFKGWVVQVGSFRQKGNAIALRDRLKIAGFAAFEERVNGRAAPIYRVKVGPEQNRERANALKAKLLAKQKLKGIVMSHP